MLQEYAQSSPRTLKEQFKNNIWMANFVGCQVVSLHRHGLLCSVVWSAACLGGGKHSCLSMPNPGRKRGD
jgi:hypothetical protein